MVIPVGTNLNLKSFPWVTIAFLFTNWLIFIPLSTDVYNIDFWIGHYLCSVPGDQYPWQLITSMFLHTDFLHILFNSLFLLVFGPPVEDRTGWKDYLFLYFLTGTSANLIHGMISGIVLREELFIPSLGASGAISGVMGIYLYRCYYSKVKLVFDFLLPFRVKLPAFIILPFWFIQDFIGGIDSIRGIHQNVAFWAHVGGFVTGFGACRYLHYEIHARREKLRFIAETTIEEFGGYGEGIQALEKLLMEDPENPELHLNLARAKTRWRASAEGKAHYEKAIRLLLDKEPKKAMELFIEYWKKYLQIMEAKYQVRLSLLLNRHSHQDLSAITLQALINSGQPLDHFMEEAYLHLSKIYREQMKREDLSRYVYEKFLINFPESKHRGFVEKIISHDPERRRS